MKTHSPTKWELLRNKTLGVVEPLVTDQLEGVKTWIYPEMGYALSVQQKDAIDVVLGETCNVRLESVAGSGKSSTILAILKAYMSITENHFKAVGVFAFNKKIAEAMGAQVPIGVSVSTLNSFGFSVCRKNLKWTQVKGEKEKNTLFFDVLQKDGKLMGKHGAGILQIMSLAKAWGLTDPDAAQLGELAERYEVQIEPEGLEIASACYAIDMRKDKVLSFDDQIAYPIVRNWSVPKFDLLFVDEAQDLSPAQAELIIRTRARLVLVGDQHQAIYGFRGADPDALPRISAQIGAREMPLSVCYRCMPNIVSLAKQIVPQIEPSEQNLAVAEERRKILQQGNALTCGESTDDFSFIRRIQALGHQTKVDPIEFCGGIVADVPVDQLFEKLQDGDFVLCRCTAPLVQKALGMIRLGRKAHVLGREIGTQILDLAKRITPLDQDGIDAFEQTELAKIQNKPTLIVGLTDRIDTLRALYERYGDDLEAGIAQLFSQEAGEGVTFMTCHKSKGLQNPRVFILRPDLLPHPRCTGEWQIEQEMNLKYVAITRAQDELYFVRGE